MILRVTSIQARKDKSWETTSIEKMNLKTCAKIRRWKSLQKLWGPWKKKLEERRQRLEKMEGEPTQSDSGENEVVSKLRAPKNEKDSYERMAEHVSFVYNDQVIKSKEFKSFMYYFKGKKLREVVPNVTPENEVEMMKRLNKTLT